MSITQGELKLIIINTLQQGDHCVGDLQEIGQVLGIETKVSGFGIELIENQDND